jgi:hypothetical protein
MAGELLSFYQQEVELPGQGREDTKVCVCVCVRV